MPAGCADKVNELLPGAAGPQLSSNFLTRQPCYSVACCFLSVLRRQEFQGRATVGSFSIVHWAIVIIIIGGIGFAIYKATR
jgi:hypothetical protein